MVDQVKSFLSNNKIIFSVLIAVLTGFGVYYLGGEKTTKFLESLFDGSEIVAPEHPDAGDVGADDPEDGSVRNPDFDVGLD